MNDEIERVLLLNKYHDAAGSAPKLLAHEQGLKHRAFSVFAFDQRGRLLIQRRADRKYHSGGRWANTCCGHPRPGEISIKSARRRVKEELNVALTLRPFAEVAYCADVGGGLKENEVVKCYAATVDGFPNNPNPNEVSEVAFMGLSELKRAIVKQPDQYAPWLKIYLGQIWDDLNEVSELCTKIDTQHRKSA